MHGQHDGRHDDQDWGHRGEHADGEALDHDGGGAGDGGGGDGPDGQVGVAGAVLRGCADAEAGQQAHHHRQVQAQGRGESERGDEGAHTHEDEGGGGEGAHAHGVQQVLLAGALDGAHADGAEDGAQDAEGGDEDGQRNADLAVALAEAQSAGGDDGAHVGLEQVRAHAGHVTHVVTHVVRDGRRVAGVVLRDARLHLANKVSAHIRRLGVDPAAHAREERDAGGAEPEPGEVAKGGLLQLLRVAALHALQHHEHDAEPAEARAHHQHAHHGPGVEGDTQRGVEAGDGGGRGAHVAAHGDAHAQVAGAARDEGADDEGQAGERGDDHAHHHRHYCNEYGQPRVLAHQEGLGALLDGRGDLLHLRVTAGALHHHPSEVQRVHERDGRGEGGEHGGPRGGDVRLLRLALRVVHLNDLEDGHDEKADAPDANVRGRGEHDSEFVEEVSRLGGRGETSAGSPFGEERLVVAERPFFSHEHTPLITQGVSATCALGHPEGFPLVSR
mmetsp:Transcript_5913/g.10243  ORF Transcript_5913/g.10243 Transcript_5913/m.10243 type:complete len:501 (-) Transcript_5913:103-1605(-)